MQLRFEKRSAIAILCVCAWALFLLLAPLAVPPVAARAFSMEDEITIKVFDPELFDSDRETSLKPWGTFYRGFKLLERVSYDELETGGSGVAGLAIVEDDNLATFIDSDQVEAVSDSPYSKLVHESELHTLDCEHDFLFDAGSQSWETIDDDSHWAVCSACGAKLQVAHRPDGKGGCKDCDAELGDYAITYSFTGFPDGITNAPADMTGDVLEFEDGEVQFEIEFSASLFVGYTLTLSVTSAQGALTEEEHGEAATIPYTLEVECYESPSAGELTVSSFTPASGGDEEAIWVFAAPKEYDEDTTDFMATVAGTLTITLRLEEIAYTGNFSDTLTFSVTLEEESS